jgi:hypothetical protein
LGLFLLLLAFFILLNSLATREEIKSRAVINSLHLTFRAPEDIETSRKVFISALTPVPEPEELVDEMERLWVASIPLVKLKRYEQGQTMQAILSVNELFVGRGAIMRSDRQSLIRNTAKALSFRADGFVNELEFVLGNDDGSDAATGAAQMARAVAIARELVANGAPPDTVKVGLQQGDSRRMRMRFQVLRAASAYVDFRELGQ